jgi:Tol biopolymer transport system component
MRSSGRSGGLLALSLSRPRRRRAVMYPVFSPDGTQLAFTDGNCDSRHSVWVMNADGSDGHEIVSSEVGPLGAGYVRGLAWSAAGERIALSYLTFAGDAKSGTCTFATEGSDFTYTLASEFCWPGRQCSAGVP